MGILKELTPRDKEALLRVAGVYLLEIEIRENQNLFDLACRPDQDRVFGFKIEVEGELIGFIAGTIKQAEESLEEHFNRPTPISTKQKSAILQHLYILPQYHSNGYGSRLLGAALEQSHDEEVKDIYAEAWINPENPDAVPLLKQRGFEEVYHEQDYWAHDDFVGSELPCPSHGEPYNLCPCEGAVYRLPLE